MANDLSPHRVGKLGSSHIAALFGQSPFLTRLQLYAHFRHGHDIDVDSNERMRWGKRLQDDILDAVAERTGWEIEENPNEWVDHPDLSLRCGATIDGWVRNHAGGLGVVECKNADRDIWLRDWSPERGPAHVELQLQHQMWVSGAQWGAMAVLVGGNQLRIVPDHRQAVRLPNLELQAKLEAAVREFWRQVEADEPPDPDGRFEDVAAYLAIYDTLVPEPALDLTDDAAMASLADDWEWVLEKRRNITALYNDTRAKILARTKGFARTRVQDGRLLIVRREPVEEREATMRAHTKTIIKIYTPGDDRP